MGPLHCAASVLSLALLSEFMWKQQDTSLKDVSNLSNNTIAVRMETKALYKSNESAMTQVKEKQWHSHEISTSKKAILTEESTEETAPPVRESATKYHLPAFLEQAYIHTIRSFSSMTSLRGFARSSTSIAFWDFCGALGAITLVFVVIVGVRTIYKTFQKQRDGAVVDDQDSQASGLSMQGTPQIVNSNPPGVGRTLLCGSAIHSECASNFSGEDNQILQHPMLRD